MPFIGMAVDVATVVAKVQFDGQLGQDLAARRELALLDMCRSLARVKPHLS